MKINKLTLDEIADIVHINAMNHGFHDPNQSEQEFLAQQLLNLITECTELWDAYRAGTLHKLCDKTSKMEELGYESLTCIEEEYADIIIRTLDQCRRLKIDIARAIEIKHAYNITRPYKHGKVC